MPVSLGSVGGPAPGPEYSAGLYLGTSGGFELITGSLTTFREPFQGNSVFSHYVNSKVIFIPGTVGGANATLRLRAWLTAAGTYESAPDSARGESGDLVVRLGDPPNAPGDLPSGTPGFVIGQGYEFTGTVNGVGGYPAGFVFVPEPSSFALAALGAAGFWMFRRRTGR